MIRLLRTRQWLGGLALVCVFAAVCCFLGHWQWDKSQSTGGDLQNLAYAFNWWVFAAVAFFIWGKALRDEARRRADPDAVAVGSAGLPARVDRLAPLRDVDDPEVDAWNAWLAELNSRPRR